MKLSITVMLCAATGTLACAHDSRPQNVATPATLPTQTALVASAPATAEPMTPGAPGIPLEPTLRGPVAPAAKPADETPLTPSAGSGAARPVAPVASDPALDKADSTDDQESVAEIRALLAADKSLSPSARQVMLVARQGRVTLRGQVNTAEERAAIERSARKAANVRDVRNELVVLQ